MQIPTRIYVNFNFQIVLAEVSRILTRLVSILNRTFHRGLDTSRFVTVNVHNCSIQPVDENESSDHGSKDQIGKLWLTNKWYIFNSFDWWIQFDRFKILFQSESWANIENSDAGLSLKFTWKKANLPR